MTKNRWRIVGVAGFLMIVVAIGAVIIDTWMHDDVVDQDLVEASINQELPVGSSYRAIEEYFAKHDIGYSFVERENRFYGLVPNIRKTLFTSASIQIMLTLDNQRRLEHTEVKTIYTGP